MASPCAAIDSGRGVLLAFGLLGLGVFSVACEGALTSAGIDCSASPGSLYEQRIAPLLVADHPNTCAQCHAGGSVDLQSFLRPDACESMACLEAQGLVDLDRPESSVLLSWIARAKPQDEASGATPAPDSPLITQRIIDEERQGFLEWFRHESTCRACAGVTCPEPADRCSNSSALPEKLDQADDPGDCERETLERLFRGTIYEARGRCYPCHFVGKEVEGDDAPRWASDLGNCQVAALATQQNIIDASYIDLEHPDQSLLILKPLAEKDGGLPHGGHDKFTATDPTYEAFVYWATRYAECQQN